MASTGLTSFSLSKLSLSLSFFLFCLSLLASLVPVNAQNGPTNRTVTPFNPPSMPLAVKSPYVNAWAPLGNGPSSLSSAWPRLWTREISDDVSRRIALISSNMHSHRFVRFSAGMPRSAWMELVTSLWAMTQLRTSLLRLRNQQDSPQLKAGSCWIVEEKLRST